jgi:hypothetical protein
MFRNVQDDLMAASITQIVKQVIAVKNSYAVNANASQGSYGFLIDDARRNLFEIVEAVSEADDEVVLAIKETFGHWARPDYMDVSASIAHGGEIPAHQGEIGKILIQRWASQPYLTPRGKRTATEIERIRNNTGTYPNNAYGSTTHTDADSPLAGLYNLSEEDLLFYTGLDAKVEIANTTRAQRTVTDAGITSTLKVLGSTTAAFVAADIGSIVVIKGAGVDGVDLASEIKTVAAPNATLIDAAGTTVSNAFALIARCQSPADYQSGVLAKALSKVIKEGDSAGLASYFQSQGDRVEPMIRANKRLMPDVAMAETAHA